MADDSTSRKSMNTNEEPKPSSDDEIFDWKLCSKGEYTCATTLFAETVLTRTRGKEEADSEIGLWSLKMWIERNCEAKLKFPTWPQFAKSSTSDPDQKKLLHQTIKSSAKLYVSDENFESAKKMLEIVKKGTYCTAYESFKRGVFKTMDTFKKISKSFSQIDLDPSEQIEVWKAAIVRLNVSLEDHVKQLPGEFFNVVGACLDYSEVADKFKKVGDAFGLNVNVKNKTPREDPETAFKAHVDERKEKGIDLPIFFNVRAWLYAASNNKNFDADTKAVKEKKKKSAFWMEIDSDFWAASKDKSIKLKIGKKEVVCKLEVADDFFILALLSYVLRCASAHAGNMLDTRTLQKVREIEYFIDDNKKVGQEWDYVRDLLQKLKKRHDSIFSEETFNNVDAINWFFARTLMRGFGRIARNKVICVDHANDRKYPLRWFWMNDDGNDDEDE